MDTLTGATVDDRARAFLEAAYRTRRAENEEHATDHPLAVARLLSEDGHPDKLVLAGLLHDVLEDTTVTSAELRREFGLEVTGLVEAMTEDPAITDYEQRKGALREQIVAAGRDAATVALADKTAKLREMSTPPKERRLAHYRATLDGIEQRYGSSPLSEKLHAELTRFSG